MFWSVTYSISRLRRPFGHLLPDHYWFTCSDDGWLATQTHKLINLINWKYDKYSVFPWSSVRNTSVSLGPGMRNWSQGSKEQVFQHHRISCFPKFPHMFLKLNGNKGEKCFLFLLSNNPYKISQTWKYCSFINITKQ